MGTLSPPTIFPSVSDCSTELAIDDISPGATVRVYDGNGVLVANALAPTSPSAVIPLLKTLSPGTQLKVRQDRPTDPGFDSKVQVTVNAAPDPPPPPTIPHVVHRCSRCVTVNGMNPGHEARVLEQLSLLGSRKALRGARTQVNTSVPTSSSPVHAAAAGCKGPAVSGTSLPYPLPALDEVPAPILSGPIEDCATTVHLSGLIPGSLVTIFRTNQLPLTTCVAWTSGLFRVPPLTAGQKVWAIARMDACAGSRTKASPASNEVIVSSDLPPAPSVLPPCPGSSLLYIGSLRPGATVVAHVRGEPYFKTVSGASTVLELDTELVDGETITVRQALCPGKWGGIATVKVIESGGLSLPPKFESLLYEGAMVVRVSLLLVGGRLELTSTLGKGTLAVVEPTMGPMVDVFLPPLLAGDTLIATFTRCGRTTSNARGVLKTPRDKLPVPVITEASACGYVSVTNVLPGALVILFVNGKPVDTQLTPTDGVEFRRALVVTDIVHVAYQIAGATQFSAKVAVTAADPEGTWRVVGTFGGQREEFLAVHAALLHTPPDPKDPLQRFGWRVLYFAGSQHDPRFHLIGEDKKKKNIDATPPEWNNTRFFFADKGATNGYRHTIVPSELPYDVFCAGHAFLANGDLLVAGGSGAYITREGANTSVHVTHYLGVKESSVFDAVQATWRMTAPMNDAPNSGPGSGGRWYPTLITTASGNVIAVAGHPGNNSPGSIHTNTMVEVFDRSTLTWKITGSLFNKWANERYATNPTLWYPRIFVLPSRRYLVLGYGSPDDKTPSRFLETSEIAWLTDPDPPDGEIPYNANGDLFSAFEDVFIDSNFHTAVLLPLDPKTNYATKVLYVSLMRADRGDWRPAVFDVGDRSKVSKSRTTASGMAHPLRTYGMATILADGSILISGGLEGDFAMEDAVGVKFAEVYDPASSSWRSAGNSMVIRQYHATSLLLPDGSVVVAGSNQDRHYSLNTPKKEIDTTIPDVSDDNQWTIAEHREFSIQTYRPPYLCIEPRAEIVGAPRQIVYGSQFALYCTNSTIIRAIHLIRHGSFTHAFNFDQRCIVLEFSTSSPGTLEVAAPSDGWIGPPGFYTLFLIGVNGSVSSAGWICELIA